MDKLEITPEQQLAFFDYYRNADDKNLYDALG